MFNLQVTMILHFVPLMDEHGFGIRLTRMFELPFPPTEGLFLAGEAFGDGDDGFKLEEVTWDCDRGQFCASTGVTSQDFPIAFIPGEIHSWIERGWTLDTDSIFGDFSDEMPEGDDAADQFADTADDQTGDGWEEAEAWPSMTARKRPCEFNKLLRALVREMATLYNNLPTAYAIDQTKMFFTEEQLRTADTSAKGRFRDARFDYQRMPQKEQIAWQQRVIARYPKLAKIVHDAG